ncbi:MAG: hypothetical protein ACJ8AH_18490 [Stellaceae bacterium]
MVHRCDIALRYAQKLLVGQVLVLVVPGRAEIRGIDLEDETRFGDGLVLLFQCIGQCVDIGVFVLVVAVRHKFGQHTG